MSTWIFAALLLLAIFFEGSVTTLPLTLLILLILTVIRRDEMVFVAAFVAGLLLDVLLLRVWGQTSLFFIIFVFVILLYERKFEIASLPFIIFSTVFGTLSYFLFSQQTQAIFHAFASIPLSALFFVITRRGVLNRKENVG